MFERKKSEKDERPLHEKGKNLDGHQTCGANRLS